MIRTTEIVTPATSSALTTLAALKDELQITGTADDAYLMRRIIAASSSIATECGRVFGRETVRDTFKRNRVRGEWDRLRRDAPLELSRDMLHNVDSVLHTDGLPLDLSGWYADLGAGLLHRVSPGCYGVWNGYPLVVVFTSGWALPGEVGRDLPQTVEDVCIERAAAGYYARGRDPGIRNEAAEGVGSIRYTDALPDARDARLAPFVVHAR